MKKAYKILIGIIILLIISLMGYSYFSVSGAEIDGVNNITSKSSVTITKSVFPRDASEEHILDNKQIEILKELIVETKFIKVISPSVYYYDNESYDIAIKNSGEEQWRIIRSLGDEYISVSHQFKGKYLKIRNPEWKETIEEIMLLSD